MAELIIGDHCSVPSCKQLDFLPCVCKGCGLTFCKVHMCYTAHDCPRNDIKALSADIAIGPKSFVCSLATCRRRELIEVRCEKCGENFCLAHRMQIDHDCKNIDVRPVRMERTAQHVQDILSKAPQTTATKRPQNSKMSEKSKATATRVALMKLKQTATGDRGIPDADRIYFEVVLPTITETPPSSSAMFFSKTWSVGRVIDIIASDKKIVNNNNIAGARKLCLFDVHSGAPFASDRTLLHLMGCSETEQGFDDKTSSEDTRLKDGLAESLYNGSRVVLEYVDEEVTKSVPAAIDGNK